MNLTKENIFFNKKFVIVLISIIFLLPFFSLFFVENHSLVAHDESLYASRAKLILETNNWFTPFETAHHKTIGSYWLIALSFKIFGINEFSARLPSYVFSISSLYVLFRIIKLLSGKEIGILSIFTSLSSYLWFSYGNYCSPDTLYIFFNLLGIFYLIKNNKDTINNIKNKNLFISGICFSLPFFVRSYLQLLPLISLSPLIIYKIKKLIYSNKKYFFLGLIVGLLPLIIFYLISYKTYGISSLTTPFFLLQKKTLTENQLFEGFLFYPRNLILFCTPFFIFLINGSRYILKSKSVELKILFFYSPIIIILLLMLTASKYSHYGLFSIPLLASNASYGIYESLKNKSFISKLSLKVFGVLSFLIGIAILLSILFKSELKITYDIGIVEIFSILSLTLVLTFLSFNFIYRVNPKLININSFLSIFALQIIILCIFFAKGIIGNPNNGLKNFVYQGEVYKVISNNNIFLMGKIENKNRHLLKFYLPRYKKIGTEEIPTSKNIYGIISDEELTRLNNKVRDKVLILKEYKNMNFVKVN